MMTTELIQDTAKAVLPGYEEGFADCVGVLYATPPDQLYGPTKPATCIAYEQLDDLAGILSDRYCAALAGDCLVGTFRLATIDEWTCAASPALQSAETAPCSTGNVADKSYIAERSNAQLGHFQCDDGFPTLAPTGSFPAFGGGFDFVGNAAEFIVGAQHVGGSCLSGTTEAIQVPVPLGHSDGVSPFTGTRFVFVPAE